MTTWLARSRRYGIWLMLIAAIVVVGNYPVTTKQGVNFEVSSHRLPLYLKAFDFVSRNAQYRQLAQEITNGAATDEQRVVAIFNWTARRILPTPPGWPVVDDHILNIIIRGHGLSDQRADVFATLVTYAGVPAFWQKVRAANSPDGVILTFMKVDGRWRVADVADGFLFRNAAGELASAEDFAANRAAVPSGAASLMIGSTPYSEILKQLRTPSIPGTLRAELQMPWRRLWYQSKRVVGWERDDAAER